jgi:phosphate/sulfate permease
VRQLSNAGAATLGLPAYSHTQALIGGAILLAVCLALLVALTVGWWRRR